LEYKYKYKTKNWFQFLIFVKTAALKWHISKFYPQIQHTEASQWLLQKKKLKPVFYPYMPIGKVRIYRLLFVCVFVFVCTVKD